MFVPVFSKRNILAIIAGLVSILLLTFLLQWLNLQLQFYSVRNVSLHQSPNAQSERILALYTTALQIFSFLIPFLGGMVVGALVKTKGWLYAGYLGLIANVIMYVFIISEIILYFYNPQIIFGTYLLPLSSNSAIYKYYPYDKLFPPLYLIPVGFVTSSIIECVKTGTGGWLGELIKRRKS